MISVAAGVGVLAGPVPNRLIFLEVAMLARQVFDYGNSSVAVS
jgi:hypothetical protein